MGRDTQAHMGEHERALASGGGGRKQWRVWVIFASVERRRRQSVDMWTSETAVASAAPSSAISESESSRLGSDSDDSSVACTNPSLLERYRQRSARSSGTQRTVSALEELSEGR